MARIRTAVLFGGQSSEHEISCLSALTVIGALDPAKYDVKLVGITREGRWLLADGAGSIRDGSWTASETGAVILPDASQKGLLLAERDGSFRLWPVDLAFPILHGRFGEDGTVQGLLELAGIPCVGCGVEASAVCMDKIFTRRVAAGLGVCQADYVALENDEIEKDLPAAIRRVEEHLPYPVFVKPSDAGSSRGVSRAASREELAGALLLAAREGTRVLAEEEIRGRELECAVLSFPDGPRASGVGEVIAAGGFYSYEAKYSDPSSRTLTDPVLPEGVREEIRASSLEIFRAVRGKGLARVDWFLEEKTGRVVFSEINTMPGFTAISMWPMLWKAAGVPLPRQVDLLASCALGRDV